MGLVANPLSVQAIEIIELNLRTFEICLGRIRQPTSVYTGYSHLAVSHSSTPHRDACRKPRASAVSHRKNSPLPAMKDWYKLKPKLFKKQRQMRANFPEAMALRVHRALSWLDRAEQCEDDADGRFIFLWFAFNAVYADETEFQQIAPSERTSFKDFFGNVA